MSDANRTNVMGAMDVINGMGDVALTTAFIGLGANLGSPKQTLQQAMRAISGIPGVHSLRQSRLYSSAPVDAPGPFYVNAVAQVQTSLSARDLLTALQRIETDFGRERHFRNAPRTLDLDLLLYNEATINEPDLVVPHPRMHLRAFVLHPLAELAGVDRVIAGQPIHQLLAACQAQDCKPLD